MNIRQMLVDKIQEKGFSDEVFEEANRELGFIENQNLISYFEELIKSGKKLKNTPKSWLAYVLGITDEEPVKDLGFLEMGSPPDLDLDFDDIKRQQVYDYMITRYGRDKIANIGTFGVFAAKGAIRYVAGALELIKDAEGNYDKPATLMLANQISKCIPFTPGVTIQQALDLSPEFRKYCTRDPMLLDVALRLEGTKKYTGKHPAGIVVSKTSLSSIVPLQVIGGTIITQYNVGELEKVGLIKFDLLGLRTISVIEQSICWIKERHGVDLSDIDDMDDIIFHDKKTLLLLKSCLTDGVFQLESEGMKKALAGLTVDSFDDVNAVIALFRPGPKKYISRSFYQQYREHGDDAWEQGITYAENKKENMANIKYIVPELADILDETYGVIVYQEQVSQIAQDIAGFDPSSADILRYAMGKKRADIMKELRPKFIEGVVARGYTNKIALIIWDRIQKFAAYAFNKAHSASYAKIAFQTAYLKANYPLEFFAALLTSFTDDEEKMVQYERDAKNFKIKFLNIHINKSCDKFTPEGENSIRIPFNALKGIGKHSQEIVRHQPYKDLYDFCSKVNTQLINKRVVEALINAQALKCFGKRSDDLLVDYEFIRQSKARQKKNIPKDGRYKLPGLFD